MPELSAADAHTLREPSHARDAIGRSTASIEDPPLRTGRLPAPSHPYRPEAEGAIALPQHEFGLDVIALVGGLRHREHRSVPEIHAALRGRGVAIAERSVTNLLDRYDELLAVSLTDSARLRGLLASQGRVILALDGLQPDVGHEVLWVMRDCLSGEVLLARSLLSGTADDLAPLLLRGGAGGRRPGRGRGQRRADLDPPCGGTRSARCAAPALPVSLPARSGAAGLRGRPARQEAAEEADTRRASARARRGGPRRRRPQVVRGYCAAVRSAITDDGRPPLAASGLALKGGWRRWPRAWSVPRPKGAEHAAAPGAIAPADRTRPAAHAQRSGRISACAYAWVHQAAHILNNREADSAAVVRRRLRRAARRHAPPP